MLREDHLEQVKEDGMLREDHLEQVKEDGMLRTEHLEQVREDRFFREEHLEAARRARARENFLHRVRFLCAGRGRVPILDLCGEQRTRPRSAHGGPGPWSCGIRRGARGVYPMGPIREGMTS